MAGPKLLAKTYEPKEVEDRIYAEWMEKGYFRAEIDKNKKPFTIVIPPPSVTGQLHMGYALDDTIQDILIRMKRMQGYCTLWLPGTAHAGISTEAKVVEKLKKDGLREEDIGREKFTYNESKSLENGIDPLEVINQYGIDALRLSLMIGKTPGNDIRFSTDRIESVRNFENKIWNTSRFVLMNMDSGENIKNFNAKNFTLADKWILSRVNSLVKEVTENMESFKIGIAAQKLYEFFWDEFCDWYIEMVKPRLYNAENPTRIEAQYVLNKVLVTSLKLLHPYMPFITNELYDNLIHDGKNIMVSDWPQYDSTLDYSEDKENMSKVMEIIKAVRNIRVEMNVPSSKKCRVMVSATDTKIAKVLEVEKDYFERLASSEIVINPKREEIGENTISAVVPRVEIFIPLGELVDIEKEIQRLEKERENLQKEIARVDGMLSNEKFMAKAPQKVVDEEKEKRVKYLGMLAKVEERVETMKK